MNLFDSTRATPTELCELDIYDNPVVLRIRERCFSVDMLSETAKTDELNHLQAEQEMNVVADQGFESAVSRTKHKSSSAKPRVVGSPQTFKSSSDSGSSSKGRPGSAISTARSRPIAQVPKLAISKYSTLAYKPANVKKAVRQGSRSLTHVFSDRKDARSQETLEVSRRVHGRGSYPNYANWRCIPTIRKERY